MAIQHFKFFLSALILCTLSKPALAGVDPLPRKIAWYGTLDTGLQVATRANRPILLISGAPHCHGVPGIW